MGGRGAGAMDRTDASRVPHVLAAQSGERILDMCAFSGGRTTQIAPLMGGTGKVRRREGWGRSDRV